MESIQTRTSTQVLRYREIVVPLARHFDRRGACNVLSFGCSRGDEIVPMALLAPAATILGVDVDESALAEARSRWRDTNSVRFERSTWPTIRSGAPYDLIMANAVLCRHPDGHELDDLSGIFPFSMFEDTLGRLVECLSPGGILMVQNANYFVMDAGVRGILNPVETAVFPFAGIVPKFDADGRKAISVNNQYACAVRVDDNRDPYEIARHSVFVNGDAELAREYKPLFFPPDYTVLREGWLEREVPARKKGWRPVPLDRAILCVDVDGGTRLLQRYLAEGRVIGESLGD